LHNLNRIKQLALGKKIIAMVKANAYGCGVHVVAPVLEGQVDAFGVACIEEALTIRSMGVQTDCVLFQGVFSPDEYKVVATHSLSVVVHHFRQVQWLVNTPLAQPIKVWVKVNTGMNRLGFQVSELAQVQSALRDCAWVDKHIGLMTHMACADEPWRVENEQQIALFQGIDSSGFSQRSLANSAALIAFQHAQEDVVRPGIMLYGVSPFPHETSIDLGLLPVMRFMSGISVIHKYPAFAQVGYGASWSSDKPSVIGVVAAGYGDGYPKHIAKDTPVWVRGKEVPIVGRVSMDMMTVDLTDHPDVVVGDPVELWGQHVFVERIAKAAGTSGYELLCQISERVRHR
jgi:alanine racemase